LLIAVFVSSIIEPLSDVELSTKGFSSASIFLATPFVELNKSSTAFELEAMALLNFVVSDKLALRLELTVMPISLR